MREILKVHNLVVKFGEKRVIDRVSFSVFEGEVFGIVGESGAGKTLTGLSVMRLLPENAEFEGEIFFDGRNISALDESEMRKLRGRDIALIPQNPHSAFNPVFKVGYQVVEPLFIHYGIGRKEAYTKASEVFRELGISEPEVRLRSYPHELSGGMKQRATISISILVGAKLIIADEPTTALDPTIASQILKILRSIVDERKSSIIFISHDISSVGWISDRIGVMYGGWMVEIGETREVLKNPLHPYTKALIDSLPKGKEKPKPIPGSPLDINWQGCRFAKRCPVAQPECFREEPEIKTFGKRAVKCFFPLQEKI